MTAWKIKNQPWKYSLTALSLVGIAISIAWMFHSPCYEPLYTLSGSVAALLVSLVVGPKFAKKVDTITAGILLIGFAAALIYTITACPKDSGQPPIIKQITYNIITNVLENDPELAREVADELDLIPDTPTPTEATTVGVVPDTSEQSTSTPATSQPPAATNTPSNPQPPAATNTPSNPQPPAATNTPSNPQPPAATNTPSNPQPPAATNTPSNPQPPTATNTPSNLQQPTATNTVLPTSTNTPIPPSPTPTHTAVPATSTPTATNTPEPSPSFVGYDFETGTQGWESITSCGSLTTASNPVYAGGQALQANADIYIDGNTNCFVELFVDFGRAQPIGMTNPGPYDLSGKIVSCHIYLPNAVGKDSDPPEVLSRMLVKDINWVNHLTPDYWVDSSIVDRWITFSVQVGEGAEPGFDATKVQAISIRVELVNNSSHSYNGPVYIDHCSIE